MVTNGSLPRDKPVIEHTNGIRIEFFVKKDLKKNLCDVLVKVENVRREYKT